MKRPLLFILSFLIIGILMAIFIENLFFTFSLFLVIFFISLYFSKRYEIKYCNLFFVVSLLGYFIMSFNCNLSSLEKRILNETSINGTGIIKNVKMLSNGDFSVIIKVNQIYIDEEIIQKNFYINSYIPYNEKIYTGYEINFDGKFVLGDKPRNPSEFNEYTNLKAKGIDFKVYIDNYEIFDIKDKFSYYIANLNTKIEEIYDGILPEQESGILKAMLLGNKDFLQQDIKDLYRNAGIYHILAISGLHICILAVFLNKIFSKLHKRYGKIFVVVSLILYCLLTGSSISTIRATFMCCIMLLGEFFYRDYDMLSAASLSSIILLILNPFNIFNAGFLYSFVSVFSIGFLGLSFSKKYNLNGLASSLVISFFVSLAIKPITAYYFYNFNTIDFLINLIIIPFTSIVVCMGFLVTLVGIISIPIAEFLVGTVYYIFRFFTFTCKIIENIDFANIQVGRFNVFLVICFYIMLVLISYYLYEKTLEKKRQKYLQIGIFIFLIGICIGIFDKRNLKITMLDVGQGDCIIGVSGDNSFIIDGGGGFSKNVGDNVIIPYLRSEGVAEIDFVFISHMDSDHIDGILDIIGKIEIENIFIANVEHTAEKYYQLLQLSKENQINVYPLQKGDKITLGENITFQILHPFDGFNVSDENNNSLVIAMNYKNTNILFTGDIEKQAEKVLFQDIDNLEVDILKVAHHGSNSSTTSDFFQKIDPKVSLISCGVNNIYNHPSKETLNTLQDTQIFRTDQNGAITIKFYFNKYKISTMLKGELHASFR